MHLLCTAINTIPGDVILPKNQHIDEMTPLSHTDDTVQYINKVTHDINPDTVSTSWNKQNIDPNTKCKTCKGLQSKIKTSLLIPNDIKFTEKYP